MRVECGNAPADVLDEAAWSPGPWEPLLNTVSRELQIIRKAVEYGFGLLTVYKCRPPALPQLDRGPGLGFLLYPPT